MDKKKFTLRKAMTTDIPSIMALEKNSFAEDSFNERQFGYLINRAKGYFYVIEADNRIAGYISLLTNARTRYLRIYSIAIHEAYRGQGLAQTLMEQAIKIAKDQNERKITLEVNVTNSSAISLYRKNGFIPIAVKDYYYHDGSDALYMQKEITTP